MRKPVEKFKVEFECCGLRDVLEYINCEDVEKAMIGFKAYKGYRYQTGHYIYIDDVDKVLDFLKIDYAYSAQMYYNLHGLLIYIYK